VVPAVLYLGSLGLNPVGVPIGAVQDPIKLSFLVGALVFIVLVVLVVFEQIQDHLLYRAFLKNRGRRIRLSDGYFECQYCGNRKVREFDTVCPACGEGYDREPPVPL